MRRAFFCCSLGLPCRYLTAGHVSFGGRLVHTERGKFLWTCVTEPCPNCQAQGC